MPVAFKKENFACLGGGNKHLLGGSVFDTDYRCVSRFKDNSKFDSFFRKLNDTHYT
jgi:hypothetical protein